MADSATVYLRNDLTLGSPRCRQRVRSELQLLLFHTLFVRFRYVLGFLI